MSISFLAFRLAESLADVLLGYTICGLVVCRIPAYAEWTTDNTYYLREIAFVSDRLSIIETEKIEEICISVEVSDKNYICPLANSYTRNS